MVERASGRASRRAVLTGALAGLAAVVAAKLRPERAEAADGEPVLIGQSNTATATTSITNSSTEAGNDDAVKGVATGTGNGVLGRNDNGTGVYGIGATGVTAYSPATTGYAVDAYGDVGVRALGVSAGVVGTGVQGVSGQGTNGDPTARGLEGFADVGTGVFAHTNDGVALKVAGPAVFSLSGLTTIPAGASSGVVTGVDLRGGSLVLAMVQQKRGRVSVRAAVPDFGAGTITIHLNAKPQVDVTVGWFVVN
jgi:hypothetical protein